MAIANVTTQQEALAATLHVWRTAAQVVATDPLAVRQQAYEVAIMRTGTELPPYAHIKDLVDRYWSAELLAIAAVASLGQQGRVLNYQVVAAAACWRHLRHLLATHIIPTAESLPIEE